MSSSLSPGEDRPKKDLRLGNEQYRMERRLALGSSAAIVIGTNVETGESVVIKVEEALPTHHLQLENEASVYRILNCGGDQVRVPKMHWFGKVGRFYAMVTELLGPSLEDLLTYCGGIFSMKTVLMLANQMLSQVEYLHSMNYVHCDIKPDDFLMGRDENGPRVYIIDFGRSKMYCDPETHQHIPCTENNPLLVDACFCSINAHLGIELSRRDDLESLGYIFMYFLRGELPWRGLKAQTKTETDQLICGVKMDTSVETLCQGFPSEFATYLNYVRSLGFEEKPDYQHLLKLFQDLSVREGCQMDNCYDWVLKRLKEGRRGPGTQSQDDPQASASTQVPAQNQTISR